MESDNKLKDDALLVYNISMLDEIPDIIEIESKLPVLFNIHSMLMTIKRWNELSITFNRPIRIYATCENREVEKCMQRLLTEHDNLFLTILPERKE